MAVEAPAAPSTAPATPAAPAPALPQREIRVSEMGAPSIPTPGDPPRGGKAKDRLMGELRKKAKNEAGQPVEPPAEPPAPAKPTEPTPPAEPAVDPNAPPTAPAVDPKDKKVNPWKLKEEWEKKAKEAENKLLDAEKRALPEAKIKEWETNLANAQKRIDELEGHIRYVDYTKSSEFQEQYQKPYEQAWQRAMGELGEITVSGPDGGERPINAQDILELVNLPLPKAKALAEEKFGGFSSDVMGWRKEIRSLFDKQSAQLEKVRAEGKTREEQQQLAARKANEELSTSLLTEWKTANDEALVDKKFGVYFNPKENDPEGNQRLTKGYQLADRAFSMNASDPKLTPAERKNVVRLHAAVRNRAAAFGRVAAWNQALEAQVAALTQELAQYKGSEPPAGGHPTPAAPAGSGSAKDRLMGDLRKLAKNL